MGFISRDITTIAKGFGHNQLERAGAAQQSCNIVGCPIVWHCTYRNSWLSQGVTQPQWDTACMLIGIGGCPAVWQHSLSVPWNIIDGLVVSAVPLCDKAHRLIGICSGTQLDTARRLIGSGGCPAVWHSMYAHRDRWLSRSVTGQSLSPMLQQWWIGGMCCPIVWQST